ncbi:hypothetical protein GGS21DRAFT_234619 [Xylaria nigripes]|nr:hypothetical protein GGS21DRAFT_234619 [Xylaria nigripes]
MCIVLDVPCSKARSKSKTGHKKTSKTQKCLKCPECTARKVTREEVGQMFPPMPPNSMAPMTNPILNHPEQKIIYGWEDWPAWEGSYPTMMSKRQWKDYTKMSSNAYDISQEKGAKIGEAKSAIIGEIKNAQRAIKDAHVGVISGTESRVKETRDAVDLAHASIRNTHIAVNEAHLALKKTQDIIQDNQAEIMNKQEACAADVARIRQLLEEEAKQREETRRVQEMVRYAQSQGLLQKSVQAQELAHAHGGRDRSSRSSSPDTSASSASSGTRRNGRRSQADGEQGTQRRWQWEREREKSDRHQRVRYSEAMRGIADTRQRLRQEQERWSRAEWELDWLRRRDLYFHHPRSQEMYYDDGADTSLYNADPFVEHNTGSGGGHIRDKCGRVSRRVPPKCRQWDH